jgi:hypothetical protein
VVRCFQPSTECGWSLWLQCGCREAGRHARTLTSPALEENSLQRCRTALLVRHRPELCRVAILPIGRRPISGSFAAFRAGSFTPDRHRPTPGRSSSLCCAMHCSSAAKPGSLMVSSKPVTLYLAQATISMHYAYCISLFGAL